MSEIRDKVIYQLANILVNYEVDKDHSLNRSVDKILSIPELVVVDREAKLPKDIYNELLACPKSVQRAIETPSDLFIYLTGEYDAQLDMLKAGWVKEVKEARRCVRCGAIRTDDIDSDICGSCADDLRTR